MSSIPAKELFKKGEVYLKKAQKFYHSQQFKEANRWLDQALEKFQAADAIFKEAEVLDIKGNIAEFEGRFKDALNFFQRAAKVRQDRSNFLLQGLSFYNLARAYFHLSQYEESLSTALKSYDLFEMGEPSQKKAEIMLLLSQIYYAQQNYKSAAFYLSLTQEFLEKHPNYAFELLVIEDMAHISFQLGELEKAEKYYLKALQREHELGNFMIVLNILSALMELYVEMEDFKEVKKILTDFIKMEKVLYNTFTLHEKSKFHFQAAKILYELGEFSSSAEYCEEAIENNELQPSPDLNLLAQELILMSKNLIHTLGGESIENLDKITPYLEEAKEHAQKAGNFHPQIEILLIYERIARLKADIHAAKNYQETAMKLAQESSHKDELGIAEIWEEKAIEAHKQGNLEQAREYFQNAQKSFMFAKEYRHLASVYYNLACVSARLHLPEDVLHYLEKAIHSNPKFRKLASCDEDFHGLHENELFLQLIKE